MSLLNVKRGRKGQQSKNVRHSTEVADESLTEEESNIGSIQEMDEKSKDDREYTLKRKSKHRYKPPLDS
jgi:hypothetical protein